jgi:hypothetical protein
MSSALSREGQDGDADDHDEADDYDQQARRPVGAALRIGLVGTAAAPTPAHRLHSRRSRNGVVSASLLETLRSCLRTRFKSLPWYEPSP